MSDLTEFFLGYAERILGRPLSDDEAKLVSEQESRKQVRAICSTFEEAKPKKSPSKKKKSSWVSPEKELEMVIDEVESGSSESIEG